jgi:indolepyruvate decarboxylase
VQAFVARISAASQPVLLVGVEAARHRLQPELRRMMASGGMPAVTTVLGKAVLPEGRDGALGVYAGVLTPAIQTRRLEESSDLVVMLGAEVTDVDCGAFTADLKRDRLLVARSGWVGDGYSRYASELPFAAFVRALAAALPDRGGPPLGPCPAGFDYDRSESQMDRYLGVVAAQLQEDDIIVADTGDSCFGSLWITTRRQGGYLAPTFYNSMGFAIPVALGAQLADPSGRPIVLAGDGAFQMTGLELSNMVRRRLDPIVLVFNNGGYGMQRIFVDGPFNDIGAWDYTRIPELLGGGQARRVASPAELAEAIERARAFRGGPSLIEVVVAKGVISTGLRVFGQALRREKTGACPLGAEGAGPCQHRDYCAFCRATIWRS